MSKKQVTLLVENGIADELQKKGLAEIVLRQKNAKFKAMVKCALENTQGREADNTVSNILDATMRQISNNSANIEKVNHSMKHVEAGIDRIDGHIVSVSNNIKNLSSNVDMIFRSTQAIQAMSFLNVGLSLANIAINVAGFTIISNHLTSMDNELRIISQKIDDIKNIEKNDIYQEFHSLTMDINTISDQMESEGKDKISSQSLEELLKKLNAFIDKIIRNIKDKTFEISELLNMIFSLLVPYTALLCVFITKYYLKNKKLPKNYDLFIGLYDALLDDSFLDVEWKYWFFEKAESNHNTTCIMNAQKLLTLNCYTEISDRVELLSLLKTKGKVDKFDKEMDETVHRNITEVAPEVAKLLQNTSASECEQVLQSLSLN